MNLPELGVRRPVLTTVVFILILVFGIISLANLALDLMPDISFPALTIITTYSGTGPEEIESSVTKIIEDSVSTVPKIKKVLSKSMEGISVVSLEFEWGTDLDSAANDVRDALDFIKKFLPDEAEKPIIFKFSTSLMPIIVMGVRAKESYPKLRKIMDDKVADVLKQVDGVGNITVIGGLERQIKIELNQAKLNGYNLTIEQIIGAIRANNITQPGGTVKIGRNEYILRVPGEYKNIEQIKRVIVGNNRGIPIYLENVANVVDGFKEDTMIVRMNKTPALILLVQKQSGANTVEVSKKIFKKLEIIKKTLPSDIKMNVLYDGAEFIRNSINNLNRTIMWGGIFVVLIVFLFLIDWRASVIIAVTIPFSLIVAFIVLYIMGYTINIMSLSSLAIAIGMVVDNGIVVMENIYRHRYEEKMNPNKAAIKGTNEVAQAILASTLTTVAIFIPVLFVGGIVGIMFSQLAISVVVVLSSSLFVAMFLSPMVASRLLHKKLTQNFFVKAEEKNLMILGKVKNVYRKILDWAISHRKQTIFIAIGIFIFSLLLLGSIGKEFFPESDEGFIQGDIELESGRRIEETYKVMKKIEDIIAQEVPEAILFSIRMGKSATGFRAAIGKEEDSNMGVFIVKLIDKNKRKRSSKEIGYLLTKRIRKIPGIKKLKIDTTGGGQQMFGISSKPISIEIYGYDLDKTTKFARKVKTILESIKGTANVTISRKLGKEEVQIIVNREKAQKMGLTLYQISEVIKNSFEGITVSRYKEGGDEYDIFLRLRKQDRKSIDNVKNIMIRTPMGKLVSIASIADFIIRRGPRKITRQNKERMLTVDSEIYGRALSKIVADFNKKMENIIIPNGVHYKIAGAVEQQQETFAILFQLLFLGIILIYLIMAGQFESFIDPFIIMFSVPFAIVGVLLALFFTGVTLNVMSFVGMVMLVGIVVNNGIVLVDYINQLRRNYGMKLMEAVKIGCERRLRPVLMTALTTIFGLMPMALSKGEGAEMWVPLGVSVIGGLFVSTMVTLVLIPTIYIIVEKRIKNNKV